MFIKLRYFILNISITGKHHHSSAHNGFAPDDDGNHISVEVFQHILDRQFGLQKCKNPRKLVSSFVSQHMPDLFQEKEFKMGKINKIFCSKWLDDKQVVLGTKCNKVGTVYKALYNLTLNINNGRSFIAE